MTVERMRVFVGATELSYSNLKITKTNDQIVNNGVISIVANAAVTNSSVLDITKADGSTTIFKAVVQELEEKDLWNMKIFTNGYELLNVNIQNVYNTSSPEVIVKDVVDNNTTNLTYASQTTISGVTVEKYIADAYAIDVIKDMMDTLDWQIRVDESDNVYFEPKGYIQNGVSFTHGTDINITKWEEDKSDLFNHVRVKGGFENHSTSDSFTSGAAQVVFTLTHKPSGNVIVTVDGTEQAPDADNTIYQVDAENKNIIFTSTPGVSTVVVTYDFNIPVVVDDQDDDSIATYDEIYQKIDAPWLDDFGDARRYASNLLDVFSTPLVKAKAVIPALNFNIDVGEIILLTDNIRGKEKSLVINKITYDGVTGQTELELGSRDTVLFDWQREVQDRIKKLERRFTNESDVAFSRIFKHSMSVTFAETTVAQWNRPVTAFIFNHDTLGRLRTNKSFEADCSDQTNNGTWQGTSINGAQYSTAGFRLNTGSFNGTDTYITTPDDASLDLTDEVSIGCALYATSLPGASTGLINKYDGTDGYWVRINPSNKVEFVWVNSGASNTATVTDALSTDEWKHYFFVKRGKTVTAFVNGTTDTITAGGADTIGTNSNALEVGRQDTSYYQGLMDEVMVYATAVLSGTVTQIFNKFETKDDLVLWWSMDNPVIGNTFSAKQDIDVYQHPPV